MLTTDDLKKLRDVIKEEISGSEAKVRGEILVLKQKWSRDLMPLTSALKA